MSVWLYSIVIFATPCVYALSFASIYHQLDEKEYPSYCLACSIQAYGVRVAPVYGGASKYEQVKELKEVIYQI